MGSNSHNIWDMHRWKNEKEIVPFIQHIYIKEQREDPLTHWM